MFRTISRIRLDGAVAGGLAGHGVVLATGAAKGAGSGISFFKEASGAGAGGEVTASLRAL